MALVRALLHNHDHAREIKAIKGHGLNTISLHCSVTCQIGPISIPFAHTKPRIRNERNIRVLPDRIIRSEDRLVEVLVWNGSRRRVHQSTGELGFVGAILTTCKVFKFTS